MKKYNNVHRKQLFYWLGHHIDYPTAAAKRVQLDDAARKKYIDALKGTVQSGLWVKTPRVPDCLGDKTNSRFFEVSRPITCFTEWLVGESLPHTTRYGRLGLGFPRRFVFERGGHPLVYVKGIKAGDQYTKNLLTLRDFLKDEKLVEYFSENEIADHQKRLDYICHFAKWATPPATLKIRTAKRRTRKKPRIAPSRSIASGENEFSFERSYGKRQELLEEREWRVVYHSTFEKYFSKPMPGPNKPDYFMPFTPGKDLFTVVLPDNRTLNMVMNDKFFIRKFYPADAPHVTVLSLDDVNTF